MIEENKTENLAKDENSGEKVYTADDLKFAPTMTTEFDPQTGKPFGVVKEQALMMFDNGYGISVRKEKDGHYFATILDKDGRQTSATDISAYGMKTVEGNESLNELLKDVQNLDKDGCVKGKEPSERGKELQLIGAVERGELDKVMVLINGGVNVNINVINVTMGENYLKDSLLDRARGNLAMVNALVRGGLSMDKIMERTRNRQTESAGTQYEKMATHRLKWLEKIKVSVIKRLLEGGGNTVGVVKKGIKRIAEASKRLAKRKIIPALENIAEKPLTQLNLPDKGKQTAVKQTKALPLKIDNREIN